MNLEKGTLRSLLKINKEKLIFLFCSGLLLFVLSLPGDSDSLVRPASAQAETEEAGTGRESGAARADAGAVTAGSAGVGLTYEEEMEERVRTILSGVDSVGEVEVMIVLKSSEEKILHVDKSTSYSSTEEKNGDSVTRNVTGQELSEDTVMESQSGTPVVEKEIRPEISGIIISADGGGNAVVKAEISEAMEALFGLPAHKIKVLKRVKKESVK